MGEQPAAGRREILCPFCPKCGTPPDFIWDALYQCWCPNEACDVFMWVPWVSAAENLAHESTVQLPLFDEEPPPAE